MDRGTETGIEEEKRGNRQKERNKDSSRENHIQ